MNKNVRASLIKASRAQQHQTFFWFDSLERGLSVKAYIRERAFLLIEVNE